MAAPGGAFAGARRGVAAAKSRHPGDCLSLRTAALFTLASLSTPLVAHATPQQREAGRFGLGLGGSWWGGGVAGRYNLSERQFVQGTIGAVRTIDAGDPGISADFMWRSKELKNNGDVALSAYYGVGATLGGGSDTGAVFGIVPGAGLQVDVLELPLDINIEYRPMIQVLPDPELAFIGIGVRVHYWF